VWRENLYTYDDILNTFNLWEKEIVDRNIPPGSVVGLSGDYSLSTCALLLALINAGAIVVPLTEAVKAHRSEFMEIAEVQYLFTFDINDKWLLEKRKQSITNPLSMELIKKKSPGLILFSSGSTGKSKAALHDFHKILEKFKLPRNKMRTLNFLLFDHIGGLNTFFYTVSNGGMIVTTSSREPENICRLIEKFKIELLPTTPTFLTLLLLSEVYKDFDLNSLRLITYGTEPMTESILQKLNNVLPKARLLQTYGLSELGILRSKSKTSDSLWVKVGGEGFETKVVNGILWIRAESAMLGYLNRDNPFTDDGWFITGDEVEVKGDYIRILGRDSDVINVGGQKVYPAEVENIIQLMDNVENVVVCSESNQIVGQIVKATVKLKEKENPVEFRKRLKRFCKDHLSSYKVPQKVVLSKENLHGERFKKKRILKS